MFAMFNECKEITQLDLSSFNTLNVNNMGLMFNKCHKLQIIKGINDINKNNKLLKIIDNKKINSINFKTPKVTKMIRMFGECNELEFLDLSNFDTTNVTDMEAMFIKCSKLKEIKGFKNLILIHVISHDRIFDECYELKNYEQLLSLFIENNNNNQSIPQINIERKEINIKFISIDQRTKFSISCCNLDNFSTIKDKLFLEFPELKNKTIYFITNGNVIYESLNLAQNHINDDAVILINDM